MCWSLSIVVWQASTCPSAESAAASLLSKTKTSLVLKRNYSTKLSKTKHAKGNKLRFSMQLGKGKAGLDHRVLLGERDSPLADGFFKSFFLLKSRSFGLSSHLSCVWRGPSRGLRSLLDSMGQNGKGAIATEKTPTEASTASTSS